MKRAGPGVVSLILLALAWGCSSLEEQEEARLRLFQRIAYDFERYNAALAKQDAAALSAIERELSRLVDENFDVVASTLSGEDARMQCDAAFALGFSRNRAALGPLAAAAASPVPYVRANAAASLGKLGMTDVPEGLFASLLRDPEAPVRQATLFGLRNLLEPSRDLGLLGLVHEKLADPVMDVRNEALILLRKLRRKESVPVILGAPVKDDDPLVRANAAATLGVIGRDALEATPALIEMLRDDVTKVVESAWVALKAMHQKDLDRSYGSWREWYEEELQHYYGCLDHPDVSEAVPGACPRCKEKLERLPREARKAGTSKELYACPVHAEILTATPGKCGKAGCGRELVPQKPPPVRYACPEHPEIVTTTPAKCGKTGCSRDLVPREIPKLYACPDHPDVVTTTPARCGKAGCGKDLVPK